MEGRPIFPLENQRVQHWRRRQGLSALPDRTWMPRAKPRKGREPGTGIQRIHRCGIHRIHGKGLDSRKNHGGRRPASGPVRRRGSDDAARRESGGDHAHGALPALRQSRRPVECAGGRGLSQNWRHGWRRLSRTAVPSGGWWPISTSFSTSPWRSRGSLS